MNREKWDDMDVPDVEEMISIASPACGVHVPSTAVCVLRPWLSSDAPFARAP